jgi:hypothetical protein
MGATTTMRELAALWPELTSEERLNYRVRFGDDVLEIISIEAGGEDATVRGYQLNGPMAEEQRDDRSRAARVRVFPIRMGIEILDRDEPVDNDDPGPPPTLRLADSGDIEPIEPPPAASVDGSTIVPSNTTAAPPENWAGDPAYAPTPEPPRSSALDMPVDTWASTAVRLPHEILDRASKEARRRGISRNILMAHLLDQGLSGLEGRPLIGN